MEVKVRVNETDMLGHINHASYFTYMEEARLDFLQKLGMEVMDDRFTIMLVSAKCDFIRQGYFNQLLEVKTPEKKKGNTSFPLENNILEKQSNELIAQGEVTIVYLDTSIKKQAKLPESSRKKLKDQ